MPNLLSTDASVRFSSAVVRVRVCARLMLPPHRRVHVRLAAHPTNLRASPIRRPPAALLSRWISDKAAPLTGSHRIDPDRRRRSDWGSSSVGRLALDAALDALYDVLCMWSHYGYFTRLLFARQKTQTPSTATPVHFVLVPPIPMAKKALEMMGCCCTWWHVRQAAQHHQGHFVHLLS